jgi:hypothetical protein
MREVGHDNRYILYTSVFRVLRRALLWRLFVGKFNIVQWNNLCEDIWYDDSSVDIIWNFKYK